MFNHYKLVAWLDINGNLTVNVRKAIEQQMKAQKFFELYGHLVVPTLPNGVKQTGDLNLTEERDIQNIAMQLIASGAPKTMPTLKKQLDEISLNVDDELLSRTKSAMKILEFGR